MQKVTVRISKLSSDIPGGVRVRKSDLDAVATEFEHRLTIQYAFDNFREENSGRFFVI